MLPKAIGLYTGNGDASHPHTGQGGMKTVLTGTSSPRAGAGNIRRADRPDDPVTAPLRRAAGDPGHLLRQTGGSGS